MQRDVKSDKTINWAYRSTKSISETEIAEHSEEVDWRAISRYQTLSEEFMLVWANKLDWYLVTKHQDVSDRALMTVKEKISPAMLDNVCAKRLGFDSDMVNISLMQRWKVNRESKKLKRKLRIGWQPSDAIGKILIGISIVGWIYFFGAKGIVSKTQEIIIAIAFGITSFLGLALLIWKKYRENK